MLSGVWCQDAELPTIVLMGVRFVLTKGGMLHTRVHVVVYAGFPWLEDEYAAPHGARNRWSDLWDSMVLDEVLLAFGVGQDEHRHNRRRPDLLDGRDRIVTRECGVLGEALQNGGGFAGLFVVAEVCRTSSVGR
jgi:hypothetical protein